MSSPLEILKSYWGYPSFRPLQQQVIEEVVSGQDLLVLMPTGGGKSITYQVPGLLMEGLCLVVSPLIALIKDQVNQLKARNISAEYLVSGMDYREIDRVLDNCIYGKIKFLYVSPERLKSELFMERFKQMNISFIAVDEAHCISQWGYDFRPAYLEVAEIRHFHPKAGILALTATATPEVVEDIQNRLLFLRKHVLHRSFYRENLHYIVVKEVNKRERVLRGLKALSGSTIIYVRSRRATREISQWLINSGISAAAFHAGLSSEVKDKTQQQWLEGEVRVMVATNAFGMGIDKADVRQVIHYDLPDCIESYFQEAGRAGRDGRSATASLLVSNLDITNTKKRVADSFPSIKTIKNVYSALGNYLQIPEGSGKDTAYDFSISDFSKHYSFNILEVYNAIKFLEREGFVFYNESAGKFSKLFIPINKETLYRYIVEHPESDYLIKEVLRSYGGIFTDYIQINETQLAKRANMERDEVVKKLSYLSKANIIKYIPIRTKPQLVYAQERLSLKNIQLSKENYANQKKAAEIRLQRLLDFLSNSIQCRSQQLLRYFGQSKVKRCGICDVCQRKNKVELNDLEFSAIEMAIEGSLKTGPKHLYNLVSEIGRHNEEHVIAVIRWLLENEKIIRQKDESLKWHNQLDLPFG